MRQGDDLTNVIIVSDGPDGSPAIRVTVDLIVFTVRDDRLKVLLIERGIPPFRGQPALPGGFLLADEDAEAAAQRELAEETGVDGHRLHLEQLRTYSAPDRDPRERVVTIAYLAIAPDLPVPAGGGDARRASWESVDRVLSGELTLAFDHGRILRDGLERARAKLEYTTLAAKFCPDRFTISDLRRVYEVVWGISIDPRNFHRKVTKTVGFVQRTDESRAMATGRPAILYRRGPATDLYPPMLRGGGNG